MNADWTVDASGNMIKAQFLYNKKRYIIDYNEDNDIGKRSSNLDHGKSGTTSDGESSESSRLIGAGSAVLSLGSSRGAGRRGGRPSRGRRRGNSRAGGSSRRRSNAGGSSGAGRSGYAGRGNSSARGASRGGSRGGSRARGRGRRVAYTIC